MEEKVKKTVVERVKANLFTAEAYEKKMHSTMKDLEENSTVIKNRGVDANKEQDGDLVKRIQKDTYTFELLRENMNSVLGVLREYHALIGTLEMEEDFSQKELDLLKTISENNMPIFEPDQNGNIIRANNEIADMAFKAIDMALSSELSVDKIISTIVNSKK